MNKPMMTTTAMFIGSTTAFAADPAIVVTLHL